MSSPSPDQVPVSPAEPGNVPGGPAEPGNVPATPSKTDGTSENLAAEAAASAPDGTSAPFGTSTTTLGPSVPRQTEPAEVVVLANVPSGPPPVKSPAPVNVPRGSDPRVPLFITFSAGTAFKTGFFGAFGVACAWALAATAVLVVGYILALLGAALFF